MSDFSSLRRKGYAVALLYFLLYTFIYRWFKSCQYFGQVRDLKKNDTFDIIIFTQQWPASSCVLWEDMNQHNLCVSTDLFHYWTIHGIWPARSTSNGPQFCNNSAKFDTKDVDSIKISLDNEWPNIRENFTEDSLWEHEWNKHGTCLISHPTLGGENNYFSAGLNLASQYNITTFLAKNGILPSLSVSYNASQIWNAIHDSLEVHPRLDCIYDKVFKEHLLWQVKLCFSKDLKVIDCPSSPENYHFGSCPITKPIYFPTRDIINLKKIVRHRLTLNFLQASLDLLNSMSLI
ncbi:ribonuclease Oy-like [Artemia franciscana]|uniref:Uncharacterized protein n=1 Tax=Artemia franciscana TaxID=6661 RepID=A0AA88KX40_ARTSF|nr:hypothetical protein QYM36_015115 [Artemia franciscana]